MTYNVSSGTLNSTIPYYTVPYRIPYRNHRVNRTSVSEVTHPRLSHLLHEQLHWLDVSERIQYKLGVTMHRCLQYKAPEYLVDCCTPVSDIQSRRHLPLAVTLPLMELAIVHQFGSFYLHISPVGSGRLVVNTTHIPVPAKDSLSLW